MRYDYLVRRLFIIFHDEFFSTYLHIYLGEELVAILNHLSPVYYPSGDFDAFKKEYGIDVKSFDSVEQITTL